MNRDKTPIPPWVDPNWLLMPTHCQEIGANLYLSNGQWIFRIDTAGPWLCTIIYTCIFVPPIVYLILNRNRPSVQTRSPKIVIAGFVFMMLDCILNTFLFTHSPHQTSPWAFNCNLGIFVIVVCFFGSMFAYAARMWRVKKVFVLY